MVHELYIVLESASLPGVGIGALLFRMLYAMQTENVSLYQSFFEMVQRENFVVLDTETTGLNRGSEIVQIAIINGSRTPLLDTLVKPTRDINPDATRIHGIKTTDCAKSPPWAELVPTIKEIIAGKDVIVYNAQYDRKMFHFSDELSMLAHIEWKEIAAWHCAMEMFAEWYGEINEYYQSYRWKTLTFATEHLRLSVQDAHSALGDTLMTLAVIRKLQALDAPNRFELAKRNKANQP